MAAAMGLRALLTKGPAALGEANTADCRKDCFAALGIRTVAAVAGETNNNSSSLPTTPKTKSLRSPDHPFHSVDVLLAAVGERKDAKVKVNDGGGNDAETTPSSDSTTPRNDMQEDDRLEPFIGRGDFRLNYLRKLSYSKVWVPPALRPPKHQTVIILDWDDTCLCTNFLASYPRGEPLPLGVRKSLTTVENLLCTLLKMALKFGQTFIITNAAAGWVEYSAATYVPAILPILRSIPVVSARSKFESHFPQDVAKWKVHAFLEVQRKLDSHVITNLISAGDSDFEMDAVHTMGKQFEKALVKTIRFTQQPTPEELVKQLDLVTKKFEKIVVMANNLQVGLERRPCSRKEDGSARI